MICPPPNPAAPPSSAGSGCPVRRHDPGPRRRELLLPQGRASRRCPRLPLQRASRRCRSSGEPPPALHRNIYSVVPAAHGRPNPGPAANSRAGPGPEMRRNTCTEVHKFCNSYLKRALLKEIQTQTVYCYAQFSFRLCTDSVLICAL